MAKKSKTDDFRKEVIELAKVFKPESLTGPGKAPNSNDHAANAVQLVEWGHTRLAADHLLFPELEGELAEQVAAVLRQLNYRFALGRLAVVNSHTEPSLYDHLIGIFSELMETCEQVEAGAPGLEHESRQPRNWQASV